MASDNIGQVGKFIKKTSRNTDYALKRHTPEVPRIERVRDIFDPDNSFKMVFDVKRGEEKILMDVQFAQPPPLGECIGDCIASSCEQFTLSAGNHQITLSQAYNAGSIRVFDNNIFVDLANIDEVNPLNGEVFIQGLSGVGTTVVCYTYGDCFDNEPCVDSFLPIIHTGLAPIFMDRFDRPGAKDELYLKPAGGCGHWEDLGFTQSLFLRGDGTATLSNTLAVFGNNKVLSDQFEIVVSARVLFGGPSLSWSMNARSNTAGNSGGPLGFVESGSYSHFLSDAVFNVGFNYKSFYDETSTAVQIAESSLSKRTITTLIDDLLAANGGNPVDIFIRLVQVDPGGVYLKVWKQGDDEPNAWNIQATQFDIPTPVQGVGPQIIRTEEAYGAIDGVAFNFSTGIAMKAVAIWGGPGEGAYDALVANTYLLSMCRTNPDGLTRFGHCDNYSISITTTPGGSAGGGITAPYMSIGGSWPHFVPDYDGAGAVTGLTQQAVEINVTEGSPVALRIKGQARLQVFDQTFTTGLVFYSYGPGVPPIINEQMIGSTVGGVTVNTQTWTDFDIRIPVYGGTRASWGVGFIQSPDALIGSLPFYHAGFLFANSTDISTNIRQLEIFAEGAPDCQTGNFCPDTFENFTSRCGEAVDNTFTSLPYFCGTSATQIVSTSYLQTDGRYATVTRQQGTNLDNTGGELTMSFKAFGVTTNGGDGLCKRTSGLLGGNGRTSSDTSIQIDWSTPFDCNTDPVEAYMEILVPRFTPAPNWIPTNSPDEQVPAYFLALGGTSYGPSVNFYFYGTDGIFMDTSLVQGSPSFAMPFVENAWNSVKMQFDPTTGAVRFKAWLYGTTEPGWLLDGITSSTFKLSPFGLVSSYSNFKDDDFYAKIRSVDVKPV